MNPSILRSLLVGFAVGMFASCGPQSAPDAEGDAPEARLFHLRGVIQELPEVNPNRVIIDHEEIPGYMKAMIMPFRVKDAAELQGLSPGQVVTFDFQVRGAESWIGKVTATGETGEIKKDETANTTEPGAALLAEGDLLTDYEFFDETGSTVKLSDFRGMPVALTFVFSRCPVPEYCPAMMRNFKTVLDTLTADPEAPKSFRLLTISFDSWNDTPEVMKSWASAYGHQVGQPWSLLTSDSCCIINEIGANVGLKFGEVKGSYQHNLRTVVLDPEGRIRRIFTDETWKTEELVAEIKAAALPLVPAGT